MAPFTGSARLIPAMVTVLGAGATFFLPGCDDKTDSSVAKVSLGGKTFLLEVAADPDKRFLGLGKRDKIEEDGGMLFVFPNSEVGVQNFVMRDCPVDIDIIFLDGAGRILSMHAMKAEAPRAADEQPDANGLNKKYDDRLKKYSSRYPSQFVIELKGGMLQSLNLKEGELVKQKWEELKQRAQ
jgi:uncharacterized membrane protein (UPF0127 family)